MSIQRLFVGRVGLSPLARHSLPFHSKYFSIVSPLQPSLTCGVPPTLNISFLPLVHSRSLLTSAAHSVSASSPCYSRYRSSSVIGINSSSTTSRRPTYFRNKYLNMPSASDYRGSPQRKLSNTPRIPFMIGVAGGTASGKSTVCKTIMSRLAEHEVKNLEKQVVSISQDAFYRELDEQESIMAAKGKFNFDHPDAFDNELMEKCLDDILVGKPTKIPVYDFKTNSRVPNKFTVIYPSDVVLVEGILIFYYARMREIFNLKLFVDADADTRLARRVFRDIEERGRNLENVLNQYTTLVKPAFEEFCIPTKKFADVIVPRGAENKVAIDLIVQHIQDIIFRSNGSKGSSPASRSRSNSESIIR